MCNLTADQLTLKVQISLLRSEVRQVTRNLNEKLQQCTHITHLPPKQDKWGGYGSLDCDICGINMGWGCAESPDHVCHYFSTLRDGVRGVQLYGGVFHVIPELNEPNYKHIYETDDICLFCGQPEERK